MKIETISERESGRAAEELWIPPLEEITLSDVMKTLGDPTRLRIARKLAEAGMEGLGCSSTSEATKQALTHHLRVMREAGLIEPWYDGRKKYVRLRFKDLETAFPGLLALVTASREGPEN